MIHISAAAALAFNEWPGKKLLRSLPVLSVVMRSRIPKLRHHCSRRCEGALQQLSALTLYSLFVQVPWGVSLLRGNACGFDTATAVPWETE